MNLSKKEMPQMPPFLSVNEQLSMVDAIKYHRHQQANVIIEKFDSTKSGPYPARFSKNNICIECAQYDIQAGDVIVRKMQNGRDERNVVISWSFRPEKTTAFENKQVITSPSHYQVEFIKEDTQKMQQKIQPANININNSQVQIGDHNVQNIINAIQNLQNRIDTAAATPEEKAEVKSLLSQFLSHPVTVAILGGLSGGLVG